MVTAALSTSSPWSATSPGTMSSTGCKSCSTGTGRAFPTMSATSWAASGWSMPPARWSASASVGTRCWIALLEGGATDDPLLLQIKEADASVMEPHLGRSAYRNHARRVVEGQQLMQAASDLFLGWTHDDTSGVDYYWRNLRDMKVSADINAQPTNTFLLYAELCGATLARAHARSGDAAAISGYLGKGKAFGKALGRFATAYADQNERDHAALVEAIKDKRVPAESDV